MQINTHFKNVIIGFLGGGICDAFFRIYWWIKTYEQCLFKIKIFSYNISLYYYFLLIEHILLNKSINLFQKKRKDADPKLLNGSVLSKGFLF